MNDAKMKLTIQTALDNAGIKATQEQIEGLAKSLQSANLKVKNSTNDSLSGINSGIDKARMGIKTFMKDVAIAVGAAKMIGTAMVEVYQHMNNEGKSFSESFSSMWSNMADKMRKALWGVSVREMYEKIADESEKSAKRQIDAQSAVITKMGEAVTKINDETLAYVAQKEAVTKLKRSGDDSRILQMMREKIMQTGALKRIGDEEGAEQLGRLYDYRIEQATQQNEIEYAKREYDKQAIKWNKNQEKFKAVEKSLSEANTKLSIAQRQWDEVQNEIDAATQGIDDQDIVKKIAERIRDERKKGLASVKKSFEKVDDAYTKQQNQVRLDEIERATLSQQLENTRMRGELSLYEKAQSYNDYVNQNGDVIKDTRDYMRSDKWANQGMKNFYGQLSADVDDAIKQMNNEYDNKFYRTEEYQARTAAATEGLAEKLDMLLEMKQ